MPRRSKLRRRLLTLDWRHAERTYLSIGARPAKLLFEALDLSDRLMGKLKELERILESANGVAEVGELEQRARRLP